MTNDLEKLREEIARIIAEHISVERNPIDVAAETADAILSIPTIADRLAS